MHVLCACVRGWITRIGVRELDMTSYYTYTLCLVLIIEPPSRLVYNTRKLLAALKRTLVCSNVNHTYAAPYVYCELGLALHA